MPKLGTIFTKKSLNILAISSWFLFFLHLEKRGLTVAQNLFLLLHIFFKSDFHNTCF